MASETIGSMLIKIGVDLTDFEKNMKEFNKTFGKVGGQVQQVGRDIGMAFTAGGAAIATGLGFAVKSAMDFDAQMAKVGAVAGATGDDLAALRQTALDLGASTSKSAGEVAEGMQLMAEMGFEVNEVIGAMPGVIAAAEASGEDMALVSKTVASALNAFGLEAADATRVADVLAQSANTSAAGVNDLQFAFKYAAPVANSLGISMEQLAAATGIMADAGMKGEQAGTTLRAALLRLTDPPKEVAAKLKELGVSVTDAAGNFLPFDQIIGQLTASTANMKDAQKAAALSTIFGTEAMTGMLTLVEAGPDKFNQLTGALENSGGASAATAAKMKDNLAGSMEQLSGAVETLQIGLGSALAPAIRTVADAITGLVNWFNNLSPQTQQYIAIGAALVAGMMLLIGVLGFVAMALGAVAAAQWAVILPIAAIVAGVALLIAVLAAAFTWLWNNNAEFRDAVTGIWNEIKSIAQTIFGALAAYWEEWGGIISTYFKGLWKGIEIIITTAFKVIQNVFGFFAALLRGDWEDAWNHIKNIGKAIWDGITGLIENFANTWGSIWDQMQGKVLGVWEGIKSGIKGGINWVIGAINKLINGFNSIKISIPAVDIPLVGTVGGFTISMPQIPNIPQLATGTNYVPQDMLAYIHKGEAIVPKEYNHAGAGGGPMTVIFEIDGRAIAKKTFEHMGGTFRIRGAVT